MESTLVLLMGSMMSKEGQAAFESPIRWHPQSAEWARKARCSIAGLPHPVGYGANRATPCSQFIYKESLPVYYETLYHIFKTIFGGCGGTIKSESGDWKYDPDFVWCSTDYYPTIWHLAQAWLLLDCPHDAKEVTTRDVQLIWKNHATKRVLPLWESYVAIKPPPELSSFFSARTGLSLSRCAAVQLRHHIRDYLIAKGLLILDTQEPRKNRIHATVCRQMSHWVEIHRSYQDRYSDMPPRVSTAERLLSLFQEKRDLWLGEWAREFEQINLPTGSEGKRVNDLWWPVPIYHQAKSVTSVAQKTRDLVREVMKEGMGILADRPWQ
jgi:hypothetical protein